MMRIHPSVLELAKRLWVFLPIPGAVALGAYLLTMSHSVYPGYSATLTAQAAGVIPSSMAAHPLFSWAAHAVAALPVGSSLPLRLNAFSVLCGTLCVMLLYHLAGRLTLFSACEDEGGGGQADLSHQEDEEDSLPVPKMPPEVDAYNLRMRRIAIAGGVAASLLFTFTAPVWSASTRLDNSIFTLLLALGALSLFPVVNARGSGLRLTLSVFLFVLGLFESAVVWWLLPFYVFLLFRAVMFSPSRGAAGCGIFLGGVAGTLCAVYAFWQNTPDPAAYTLLTAGREYARPLAAHHYYETLAFFPHQGWLLALLQIGVPSVILLFGQQILFKEKRASTLIALFLLVLSGVPGFLNLSFSPYEILTAPSGLPVFGYAVFAVAAAMACAVCLKMICQEDNRDAEDGPDDGAFAQPLEALPHWVTRGLAGGLLAVFCGLLVAAPWRSSSYAGQRQVEFADRLARRMLDEMGTRTCLVSNGLLDNHLLIQAALLKKPLSIITLRSREVPQEIDATRRFISSSPYFEGLNRQRLQNALSLGTVRFVMEWLNADTNMGQRAMIFASPELWSACGYRAVPEGLAFGGIRAGEAVDVDRLVARNREFSEGLVPLLAEQPGERGGIAFLRAMLRMKAGFAANELGVLLEDESRIQEAYQVYTRAGEIDPMNVSGVVNGYLLATAYGLFPEAQDGLKSKMMASLERYGNSERVFTAILQNHGSIRHPAFYKQQTASWAARGGRATAADKMRKAVALSKRTGVSALVENASVYQHMGDGVQAEASYRAALKEDSAHAGALSGMCMLLIGQSRIPEAEEVLKKAQAAGVSKDVLLYQAILLALLQKDTEKASALLAKATREHPSDLRFWTLQADLLLSQGDTRVVEQQVLPQMQKVLKNKNHFLVHAIRGSLLKEKGERFYKEARLSFLEALALNADLPDIWNALLDLDMRINNPDFTGTDVRNRLRTDPEHALANYLMGALLLANGDVKEAEDFLRRSIERKPTSAACNDLAENLRLQKKLAEAESFARRALELEPGLVPAQDTLACILLDRARYDEAARVAGQAVAAQPNSPLYRLTMLRSQVKLGDKNGVWEQLKKLSETQTAIPDALQKEINAMR